jgi:hypothetical protein
MNIIAKRIIFLLSCTVLISSGIYSQNTPYFETTFYFEDAVGNKDSVIIGYDLNINPLTINENFGEKEIKAPFDSVFEVRAFHLSDLQNRTSKKIIGHAEPYGPYLESSRSIILVRIIHKPLKVTYDISKFYKEIRSGSFLSHTFTKDLLGPEYIKPWEFFCLSTVDLHIFTFPDSLYGDNSSLGISYIRKIEGNTLDTLYGIEASFLPYECLFKTSTSNIVYQQLNCFPTIGQDYINIAFPNETKPERVEVMNLMGQGFEVNINSENNICSLDINMLPKGMYIGVIGKQYYFKFIKM